MENPATWTPLHRELNNAYYNSASNGSGAVLNVLHSHGYDVTLDQVERVINRHKELMQLHFCGLSLCSMLVNELATESNKRY